MPGIDDPNAVDVVTQEADGTGVMIISHVQPWVNDREEADRLLAKINAYAAWALDGGLVQQFPQLTGKPLRIQVDCVDTPGKEVAEVLAAGVGSLGQYGIEFKVNRVNRPPRGS